MGIRQFNGFPRLTWSEERFLGYIRDLLYRSPMTIRPRRPLGERTANAGHCLETGFGREMLIIKIDPMNYLRFRYTDGVRALAYLAGCPFAMASGLSSRLHFEEKDTRDLLAGYLESIAGKPVDRLMSASRRERLRLQCEHRHLNPVPYAVIDDEWRYLMICAVACNGYDLSLSESRAGWFVDIAIHGRGQGALKTLTRELSTAGKFIFRTEENARFFMAEFDRVAQEVRSPVPFETPAERQRRVIAALIGKK